jgi:4,5-dihydroxyphthalate decarboxylase
MNQITLNFAAREYDRTRALMDGRVKPEGINLRYSVINNPDAVFRRMLDKKEFDACEFSLSTYLTLKSQKDQSLDAIPIFLSRLFRHSYIFCNKDSKIREPLDLVGKNVAIMEWQQTAAVWIKGILQHEYDVPLEKIHWVAYRGAERYGLKALTKFDFRRVPEPEGSDPNEAVSKGLESGEVDALLSAHVPDCFYTSNKVERLFENYVEIESDYYRKTGIFPIMHTFALRRPVIEENHWIAENLIRAFNKAKELAYEYLAGSGDRISSVWLRDGLETQHKVLGPDPYPYNFKDNKKVIEMLMSYQIDQQIIEREYPVEDIFVFNE